MYLQHAWSTPGRKHHHSAASVPAADRVDSCARVRSEVVGRPPLAGRVSPRKECDPLPGRLPQPHFVPKIGVATARRARFLDSTIRTHVL
jgi:hypothetical protein